MRSGFIGIDNDNGGLRNIGGYGVYWASTAYPSTTHAYNLGFSPNGTYPESAYDRWNSLPLRCLSTVLGM